ncbi:GNAT family N-acetyltransferase [Paenibacillus albiflavus]|uniref:GNAT family N-acetyltransferase n=1 Tax=Paenibacillus albiflavus TaxID=2545760 RepID=A0A4R4ERJ3_9BACL|nr:GNAT family N-acetyltransferase [Paenibacillus albiflavus]TCZ81058.1 GNAT family N-acetyltransferase [Paenibacillus albiflavus]
MLNSPEFIRTLEKLAYDLWPPEHEEAIGEWRLRASQGITKRANSVFTLNQIPDDPNWFTKVSEFYQQHQLPVHYHVSDASPSELKEILASQGFYEHTDCTVMVADTEEVQLYAGQRITNDANDIRIILTPQVDESWIQDFLRISEYDPCKFHFYAHMLERIKGPQCFIKLQKNTQIIGIGTAVSQHGWTGLLNIAIDPEFRGQALSYYILHALAEWASEQNSPNMFLQVVTDNIPAVKLYQNSSFKPLYQYHYWSQQS